MSKRHHRPGLTRAACVLAAGVLALAQPAARAGELIVGEARAGDESPLVFRITGASPDAVVGGVMELGDARFTVHRVSQRGLIGGSRVHDAGDASFAEYAVFSSSFSEQTAVGQPYVAARRHHHCDVPYNSFLAIYRVNGKGASERLGPAPYPVLIEDVGNSDESTVYCFMSFRGEDR